ncbi:MAG: YicC/YloC family endoribonuclease [Oscillospiraceae bacterium]
MIKSMTGYGCAKGISGKTDITVELRSVNNRFLDCNIRIPRVYTAAEDMMKELVQSSISRGKVDVFVTIDTSGTDDVSININEPLAAGYLSALALISEKYGVNNDVTSVSLTRFPDVLRIEKRETDTDALYSDICGILKDALTDFTVMRVREGGKLYKDISDRLSEIERLTTLAEERSPKTVAEYRAKLLQRMQDVLQTTTIDETRILTEAAIFADRVAVNEEIVRLRSHVSQLRGMLNSDEPVGRKLDFLVQELNREANTLGSKGNDTEMARIVIDLKSEIEKIREQIQNVE